MKKLVTLGLLLVVPALAQLDRGQIVGSVYDETGAVIPEVRITIRNSDTGATYETVSNETGQYARSNLPVGGKQNTEASRTIQFSLRLDF